MFKPWPHQTKAVDEASAAMAGGCRRVVIQAATGAGKSGKFAMMGRRTLDRGGNFIVFVHRLELLDQARKNLRLLDIEAATAFQDSGWTEAPAAVCMIPSMSQAMLKGFEPPQYKLTIADECHHCRADSWRQVLDYQKRWHVGVTATPGDGMHLMYDHMVCAPSAQELTDMGFLAPIEGWYDPKGRIRGDRLLEAEASDEDLDPILKDFAAAGFRTWEKRGQAGQTLGFAGGRTAGQYFTRYFIGRGVRSAWIDGYMSYEQRKDIFDRFRSGDITYLFNCSLVDEGVDIPRISVVQLMRRTLSRRALYQWIGRGMRLKPDGSPMILLDNAGNVYGDKKHPGLGLPTDVISWTIEGEAILTPEAKEREEAFKIVKRRGKASAASSGDVQQIPTRMEEAKTLKDAIRFIREPGDYIKAGQYCRQPKGKPYQMAYLIAQAALHFHPPKEGLSWQGSLIRAARDIGPTAEQIVASMLAKRNRSMMAMRPPMALYKRTK